ncbi:MAG: hypothetical protein KatS3mg129_2201 [Leptospiraceae bacterium]|nr:MAG: hypothetical protein KatS3mg129_2201 [Leptospiraceae bacterium]
MESIIKNHKKVICISSPTLEIGIDIGDISLSVLLQVPLSIASLMQRIGRSNRNAKYIRSIAFYYSNIEKEVLEEMFYYTKNNILDEYKNNPNISVVVQQVFSMLYAQPKGLKLEEMYFYLEPLLKDFVIDFFEFGTNQITTREQLMQFIEDKSKEVLKEILNYLILHFESKFINYKEPYYFPSMKLMDLGKNGLLHSNIPNYDEYNIIDIKKQQCIGKVSFIPDTYFLFAGKCWEIKRIEGKNIYCLQIPLSNFKIATRPVHDMGKYYNYIPNHLKRNYKR